MTYQPQDTKTVRLTENIRESWPSVFHQSSSLLLLLEYSVLSTITLEWIAKKMLKEQEELATKGHEILPIVPICFSNLKNLHITSHMIFSYFLLKSFIYLFIYLFVQCSVVI